MSTKRFVLQCLVFSSALFFLNCNKNEDNSVPASKFVWTHNGTNYTADVSAAYQQSIALAPFYIVGILGTNINTNFTQKIGFSLTSFNTGSYTVTGGGPNRANYIDSAGFDYSGISGTVSINTNNIGRISGNFSVTFNGPVNSLISGSFSDIPIQP